jgi:uncharacterized protein (DUF983 family)
MLGPKGSVGGRNPPYRTAPTASGASPPWFNSGVLAYLQGQVFATLFHMHEPCPVCGLRFEREPGYFTGAMSLSYGVAIIVTSPVWLMMAWLGRSLAEVLLVIGPVRVLGRPWLFRDARVLWLHLDQAFDPR